jgi:hypothetical protein
MLKRLMIAAGAVAWCLFEMGCHDHGTDPPEDKPKDYAVFVADYASSNKLIRYRVESGAIDSTDPPTGLHAPRCVSADGTRLYWNSGIVMDAEDFSLLSSLPYTGYVVVSPDNHLIAICDTDLYILNRTDYSVVFHDTDAVTEGTFSDNSKRFYAKKSAVGDCFPLYRVDLQNGNAVSRDCVSFGFGLEPLVVSTDETKLFLYRKWATFVCSFDVYDLNLDSTVFSEPLVPGGGKLAKTHDGKSVYFTNPGSLLSGPPAPYSLAVYRIKTSAIDTFMVSGDPCQYGSGITIFGHIVITADDRWIVATDRLGLGSLTKMSLQSPDSVQGLCVGLGKWLRLPVTQSGK